MRRLIYLTLALCLLLSACGGEDGESLDVAFVDEAELDAVMAGVERFNSASRRRVVCSLSINEGEDSRYFTQGTFSYCTDKPVGMSGAITQVLDGKAVTQDVFYKAGAYYYGTKEGKYYAIMDSSVVTDSFYCRPLPTVTAESVVSFRTADSSLGKKYVYETDNCDFLSSLFDEALSEYSGVKKAIAEKTVYTNGELSYVVSDDGNLAAFTASCTVTMVDTPAYYPTGFVKSEAELSHSFTAKLELTVKAVGDKVYVILPDTKDYIFLG